MTKLWGIRSGVAAAALSCVLSVSGVRAASLYLSVVAEASAADGSTVAPAPGKPVSYVAIDGGYIDSGDPVGGMTVPAPALVEATLAQALSERGYQAAAAGVSPALVIVYNWGEIRHDSMQIQPTNHLKGNDRARLLLVTRTTHAERIEREIVNDRYTGIKMGAMTRTEPDREALQLAHDEMTFVVVSAYDVAALREHKQQLVWQVKLTTRAVGQPMADQLVSLIHYGGPYFGRNESERRDLKEPVVPAASVRTGAPASAANAVPAGVDAPWVKHLVETEHAMWSGKFPSD